MFVLDTDHLGILQRQAEPQYGNLPYTSAAADEVDQLKKQRIRIGTM